MTEAEMMQSHQQLGIIEAEMKSAGVWVFSGRLHAPDTATVVRMANGQALTTDGPFIEAKEHLGGFYIIETADLGAALPWQLGSLTRSRCRSRSVRSRINLEDDRGGHLRGRCRPSLP